MWYVTLLLVFPLVVCANRCSEDAFYGEGKGCTGDWNGGGGGPKKFGSHMTRPLQKLPDWATDSISFEAIDLIIL
jgi:hypothetical protein